MFRAARFAPALLLGCAYTGQPDASAGAGRSPVPVVPAPVPVAPAVSPPPALPAAEPGAAAPKAAHAVPAWTVAQFRERRGLRQNSAVQLRGWVIGVSPCPACPASAQCKPCFPGLNIAERAGAGIGESVRLQIHGSDAPLASVRVGEEYVFSGALSRWEQDPGMPFAYVDYTSHTAVMDRAR